MANYTHQPFEDWVLERKSLTAEQEAGLQAHLQSCATCRGIAESLREVEFKLKAQPIISPQAGFTDRWQARLAHAHARSQKRQTILFLGVTLGGAALLLVVLCIFMIPVFHSPYPYMLALAYQITSTLNFVRELAEMLGVMLGALLRVVPPTLWVGVSLATAGMLTVWLMAFRRLVYKRRIVE